MGVGEQGRLPGADLTKDKFEYTQGCGGAIVFSQHRPGKCRTRECHRVR
jgi:hypothetical protein